MPGFRLPFFKRASTPPPGSSYYVSNALIIAKRVALGLETPIQIQSGIAWESGNPLFDWHERHGAFQIKCMQLRKERKAPFFHEYVTFQLSSGSCFRIDRRQLPDEQLPMGSTEHEGVEPYDTIEQIADMEDSMYSPSDCLVQLDFRQNVPLDTLIWIIRKISSHKWARVYTLQLYNCYFYAQTLLLCTCFQAYHWDGAFIWFVPRQRLEVWSRRSIMQDLREMQTLHVLSEDISIEITPVEGQVKGGSIPKIPTIIDLQSSLLERIRAHSVRVEQYKFLLKRNATDVENGIKAAMNDIWGQIVNMQRGVDSATQDETDAWLAGMGL